jgi:hypothetical protein
MSIINHELMNQIHAAGALFNSHRKNTLYLDKTFCAFGERDKGPHMKSYKTPKWRKSAN